MGPSFRKAGEPRLPRGEGQETVRWIGTPRGKNSPRPGYLLKRWETFSGRNTKRSGTLTGEKPSRRRTRDPEVPGTLLCKKERDNEREGRSGGKKTLFPACTERDDREVRKLRRAGVPDPN
jgi:hypothetical protein